MPREAPKQNAGILYPAAIIITPEKAENETRDQDLGTDRGPVDAEKTKPSWTIRSRAWSPSTFSSFPPPPSDPFRVTIVKQDFGKNFA